MLSLSSALRTAVCTGAVLSCGTALAQVQPVAFESFDFGTAGQGIGGQGSGSGWTNFWWSGNNQDDSVVATPGHDGIGSKAMVNLPNEPGSFRIVDIMPHQDLDDGTGLFGGDGSTMWFSYTLQDETPGGAVQNATYFAGLSLYIQLQGEFLFMGSPWMTEEWGIDDKNGNIYTVAGSNDDVRATIVTRVDWLAGDERVRMWIDPPVGNPTTTADIDVMVPDFRFNEIGFHSGGDVIDPLFSFDGINVEKGEPTGGPLGMNYCGPAIPNSTGFPGVISATGLPAVVSNSVMLSADQLPPGQFGYFLAGQTQGFFNPPGSSGIICLSGNIGRYNAAADIIQGPSGSLALDLMSIPVNPPTAVIPGDTWFFQCWYRDVGTSNFTDGLEIMFI